MLPDRVSNPGPLTYESGALPIALHGPALKVKVTLGGLIIKLSYVELVRAITSTFKYGSQNNLAQSFSLRSSSAILNICSGRLKVKVTLDGKMIEWS